MKKLILPAITALFAFQCLFAQAVFRHVTSAANTGVSGGTQAHITLLDHPRLNGNPNAIIFILPNYNLNGADAAGVDYLQNAGVWYNGSRWTIFNQNTKAAMPLSMTFNILVAPPGNPNCFTVTATKANIAAHGVPNGMQIDHPAANGKTDAMLLVTQNWSRVYNDASQLVTYAKGKWSISNNGYMAYWSGETTDTRGLMPEGARFNVMVIENGQVPGFPNAQAFLHTAKKDNITNPHITFLNQPGLSGNREAILFATAYWGHADADRKNPNQAGGPYNEGPLVAWFDHPNDPWKYRDNAWSLYNGNSAQIQEGAKMFVAMVNAGTQPANPIKMCFDQIPRSFAGAQNIVALHGTYWRVGETLRIRMDGGSEYVRGKVRQYANEWLQHANLRFEFVDTGPADINIAFVQGEGSWSHVGTTSRRYNPSMNFGWFDDNTGEEDFRGTILHEFGHALGAIHEHQHPEVEIPWDREAVYRELGGSPNFWTREEVDRNIFERYNRTETNFTAYDRTSIMHYAIDDALTIGNYSVPWNTRLSANDMAFMRSTYPPPVPAGAPKLRLTTVTGGDDLRDVSQARVRVRLRGVPQEIEVSMNRGARWANGSSNVTEITLPANTPQADVMECKVTFYSGQPDIFSTGDNWNVNQFRLEWVNATGSAAPMVTRNGNPVVRFTSTGVQEFVVYTPPSNSRLRLTLRTGGDDLRGGSQAHCIVQTNNGVRREVALNSGAGWGNFSTNVREIELPSDAGGVRSCVIRFTSGSSNPFDQGDNWNLDAVRLELIGASGTQVLTNRTGTPLVRFTGSVREYTVPF